MLCDMLNNRIVYIIQNAIFIFFLPFTVDKTTIKCVIIYTNILVQLLMSFILIIN